MERLCENARDLASTDSPSALIATARSGTAHSGETVTDIVKFGFKRFRR